MGGDAPHIFGGLSGPRSRPDLTNAPPPKKKRHNSPSPVKATRHTAGGGDGHRLGSWTVMPRAGPRIAQGPGTEPGQRDHEVVFWPSGFLEAWGTKASKNTWQTKTLRDPSEVMPRAGPRIAHGPGTRIGVLMCPIGAYVCHRGRQS